MTKSVTAKSWTLNTWTDGSKRSYPQSVIVRPAGMNLSAGGSGSTYFEGLPIYKNRIRESKGFFVAGSSTTLATVDASGWPTQDFQVILTAANFVSTRGEWAAGTWKCGFIGAGTPAGLNGSTASNIVPGSGGGYTTFDLTGVGTNAGFSVTGTSGSTTNIFAYLPAYLGSAIEDKLSASAFTTEAIATYSKAGYIRAMDWSNSIGNSTTMTSANRAKPSNTQCFFQNKGNGLEGLPHEDHAAFCMACAVPIWLNLPPLFDTTYLTDLANGLFALVPIGVPIYIEIADELWNGEGPGITAWAAAATSFGGTAQFFASQTHSIANAFRAVFGSRYGTDVRLVFAWQTGANGVSFINSVIGQYATNGWSMSADFYTTSIAPYFNTFYTAWQFSNTVAQILATLTTQSLAQPMASLMESNTCMGMKFGLSHICYEGGWQTNNENSGLVNAGASILDPGMQTVMQGYYQAVINSGSEGVPQWSGVDANSNSNLTPLNESAKDWTTFIASGSPRQAAVIAANAGITPTRNLVSGPGSVIQGNCYIDSASGANATLSASTFSPGPSFAPNHGTSNQATYLINCTAPGNYSLVVNFTNTGSTGASGLEFAGRKNPATVLGSQSIPAGTNNVTMGTVILVKGTNYVCLTGNGTAQSAISINTLTFN